MAKVNEIRSADLSQFLESVGYVGRQLSDANMVWEHPQFERARLILPAYRTDELVWSGDIAQVCAILNLHGVLNSDDFDRWRLNLDEPAPGNGQALSPRDGPQTYRQARRRVLTPCLRLVGKPATPGGK